MDGYVGRFAPSPTGPLHLGSLIAAMASYLEARQYGGRWLLRIEDLDPPREIAGASEQIIQQLTALGFQWDADIIWQSAQQYCYLDALRKLREQNLLYTCNCSRTRLSSMLGTSARRYPGYCRERQLAESRGALRCKTFDELTPFTDALYGHYQQNVNMEVGDFVVRRKDGLIAYQLAVVVDDGQQTVSHIVRGADLLDNTPRQLLLQRWLQLATPQYMHLPLVLSNDGTKLSKQTGAPSLNHQQPLSALYQAWHFLNQPPLPKITTVMRFWEHALHHWDKRRIDPRARPLNN